MIKGKFIPEHLLPLEFRSTDVIDLNDYKDIHKVFTLAEHRTHRFALETINPYCAITVKQALASAYVQGMSDASRALGDND